MATGTRFFATTAVSSSEKSATALTAAASRVSAWSQLCSCSCYSSLRLPLSHALSHQKSLLWYQFLLCLFAFEDLDLHRSEKPGDLATRDETGGIGCAGGELGGGEGDGGGGATGGGSDTVFVENSDDVTTNYTITSGKNAMSVGPITVESGVVVTIPSGSRWVVL